MFNWTLLITWPILIIGSIGAYKLGKKKLGNGAWLLSILFCIAFFLLLWLIFREQWFFTLIVPFIIQ